MTRRWPIRWPARWRAAGSRPRPWSAVPITVRGALIVLVLLQLGVHALQPPPRATAMDLPEPPSFATMQLLSLGDPLPLVRLATLRLQAFDNQPGISIAFAQLDYERLERWLSLLLALDPPSQYPLLLASQVYGTVADPAKQRRMIEFVNRSFATDPDRRWRWLAHAAIIARHRLKDTELAIALARRISDQATGPTVPGWARQMSVLLLADSGEVEAARVLLGGLLASGSVSDAQEIRFLLERLEHAAGAR